MAHRPDVFPAPRETDCAYGCCKAGDEGVSSELVKGRLGGFEDITRPLNIARKAKRIGLDLQRIIKTERVPPGYKP